MRRHRTVGMMDIDAVGSPAPIAILADRVQPRVRTPRHAGRTSREARLPATSCDGLGKKVAGPTRLELATSGVTGQRSNQLNYDPAKPDASPIAPEVVGGTGLEPVTAGV